MRAGKGSSERVTDVEFDRIKIDRPQYKAILFVIDGKDVWLPREQIEFDADEKTVTMPEWLAIEKELV